ncbi:hypothetical protein A2U01_0064552 [Trifolium medium]|uniref:Uncharacterized protein n=1 Tax=Trifolium medium TaxID=97028 RepID=A0A392S5Z4_9FABA|nr:hypothetical protein [Trifolium medium]
MIGYGQGRNPLSRSAVDMVKNWADEDYIFPVDKDPLP